MLASVRFHCRFALEHLDVDECPLGVRQLALLRALEIVGQSIKDFLRDHVRAEVKESLERADSKYLSDWAKFRDKLAKGYLGLDMESIWEDVHRDVPQLLARLDWLASLADS